MRRTTVRLALTVLSHASVVLALSTLPAYGIRYWYLFFSPLALSALLFGRRGALMAAGTTVLSLLLLYRSFVGEYQPWLATVREAVRALSGDFSEVALESAAADPSQLLLGVAIMIAAAFALGHSQDRMAQQEARIVQQELRMVMLRRQDPLTGLPTRQHFLQLLRERTGGEHSPTPVSPLSLIVMDLDGFGAIQERYGHFSGDRVLEQVGSLLEPMRSQTCVVGRLGSDEFGIALLGWEPAAARILTESLQATISEYDWTGARFDADAEQLTASFGVAFLPQDGATRGKVALAAWDALARQKRAGGKGICYASFKPELPGERSGFRATSLEEWREVVSKLEVPPD